MSHFDQENSSLNSRFVKNTIFDVSDRIGLNNNDFGEFDEKGEHLEKGENLEKGESLEKDCVTDSKCSNDEEGVNEKPEYNEAEVESFLREHYGIIPVSVKELDSYLDRNYLVLTEEQEHYVMKVYNRRAVKNALEIELKHRVEHVCYDHVTCPQPVPSLNGQPLVGVVVRGIQHLVDVHTYVDGLPWSSVEHELTHIYTQLGQLAATVVSVCQGISSEYPSLRSGFNVWHLENAPSLIGWIWRVTPRTEHSMLTDIILQFERNVISLIDQFPSGTIHHDMNLDNLLLKKDPIRNEYYLHGLIDFGDVSNHSPYVFEIGVAMAYVLIDTFTKSGLGPTRKVLQGYLSQRLLSKSEISVLPIVILTRLAFSYIMACKSDPGNLYALSMHCKCRSAMETYWNDPSFKFTEV